MVPMHTQRDRVGARGLGADGMGKKEDTAVAYALQELGFAALSVCHFYIIEPRSTVTSNQPASKLTTKTQSVRASTCQN